MTTNLFKHVHPLSSTLWHKRMFNLSSPRCITNGDVNDPKRFICFFAVNDPSVSISVIILINSRRLDTRKIYHETDFELTLVHFNHINFNFSIHFYRCTLYCDVIFEGHRVKLNLKYRHAVNNLQNGL